MQTNQLNH